MYTHYNNTIARAADSISHVPSPPDVGTASPMHFSTTLQQHYQVGVGELDSVQVNSEMSYNNNNNQNSSGSRGSSSSHMGSPSSMASYETEGLMQRSVSSHALQKSNNGTHHAFSAFFAELLDSSYDDGPVRTGDLQRINGMQHYHWSDSPYSPLSSESSMIIEGMSRDSPYSPEEKKVRIERYRSKRNKRNFNKKIKYACRKTLADSRPRIRGRFARNDEIVINPPIEWNNGAGEEEDEEDENWDNFFNSLLVPANLDQEPHCSTSFDVLY